MICLDKRSQSVHGVCFSQQLSLVIFLQAFALRCIESFNSLSINNGGNGIADNTRDSQSGLGITKTCQVKGTPGTTRKKVPEKWSQDLILSCFKCCQRHDQGTILTVSDIPPI